MNQHMLDHVRRQGTCNTEVFNLSPSFAAAWFPGKRWLLVKFLYVMVLFFRFAFYSFSHPNQSLYFSIAGGLGKWLEIPLLWIAMFCYKDIYIHHHSFSCCNRPHLSMAVTANIAPHKTTHIALCDAMKRLLVSRYGLSPDRVIVLSNIALCEKCAPSQVRQGLNTVGYFGNISLEKGVGEFLETYRTLVQWDPGLRALIGGPCMTSNVADLIEQAARELPHLKYLGPLYGGEKGRFFAEIDVLLFPSKYADEAEPLTIYEAFSSGVPVIAWGRGCIAGMIERGFGKTVHSASAFSGEAVATIQEWKREEVVYQQGREALSRQFETLVLQEKSVLESFLAEVVS